MKPTFLYHLLTLALLLCGMVMPSLQAQPYKNPSLSPEERTADLLQRMTLEEKIAQIRHIHSWNIFEEQELNKSKLQEFVGDLCWGFVEGFPLTGENCHRHMRHIQEYMLNHTRLGIPIFTVAEALHGSVHEGSTIYPQNIALASTFNPELAYLRATEISKELHYQGINQILAPCIDVVRDLRWGRIEESYGEDPYLNGIFAYKEAKGYLDNGISPMLKHYGAHGNPLGGLNLASVHCGIGELHDVYLQPFKKVITSLPIQAVMSAYNSWNRVPNSSSYYLLTEILRNRWSFQGYVYSDWGAIDMLHTFQHTASSQTEAAIQAISAGLDVEASSECFPHLIAMVKEKKIDEKLTPLEGIRKLTEPFGIQIRYAQGCSMMSLDTIHIASAVEAARQSDVAILFCGSSSASLARDYNETNCGEGFDLADLALTGAQGKLIKAIHATGKPVILVLVTGKPFSIAWEKKHIPAILIQWYAGEQEGSSIANILFGKTNPSGHLTVSFPQSSGHLPAYYNHLPTDRGFYHKPGSYEQPGRDYVFSSPGPLWAFGHGLTYTTFNYTDMQIQQSVDSIKVFVTVKNTGRWAGKAVPQLYVRDVFSSISTPVKQLKAFNKVTLEPGETTRVPLHFAVQDLALTDEAGKTMVEPGSFEIMIGDASDHILLKQTISIGQNMAVSPCSIKEQLPEEIGKGNIIHIKGVVRDVQATPVDKVEIYSTAGNRCN